MSKVYSDTKFEVNSSDTISISTFSPVASYSFIMDL